MYLLKQLEEFSTEEYCKAHFKELREQAGVVCKKCNHASHYWLSSKNLWQCKKCKFRTSLKSGTIMENSKMTFRKWYRVIIMMSATKKGFSAKEMQKQFGSNRYESIWTLMHKVRQAMGNRDSIYKLKDQIEMDEGYFTVETTEQIKKGQKRGRGSVTSVPVSILVESTRLEDIENNKISTQCGHLKMKLIDNHKTKTIQEVVTENIAPNSVAFTDGSTSYNQLDTILEGHQATKSNEQTTKNELKWVHTVISNTKRIFNGIHQKINKKYMQNYLDEFCYKFNRRFFKEKLFNRVIIAVADSTIKL
jgi:transposase-like protein/ribosomal protein L37AE/L43A